MGGPTRIQPEHTVSGAVIPVTPKAGGVGKPENGPPT